MLGYLNGRVLVKNQDTNQCILLAGDVGYEITLSKKTFEMLFVDQVTSLWLHTHVREDQFTLFGFSSETEKNFFRILLSVSGLGPKTALSLLSEHGAEHLSGLIIHKNISEISSAPGVGKKLAERLVLELASKLEKLTWVNQLEIKSLGIKNAKVPEHRALREDLLSALINLGYQPAQIRSTLDRLFMEKEDKKLDFENYLRLALKDMSGHRLSSSEVTHG